GIEKKGKLELHVFRGAGALHLFKFPFRQRISVAQDATDEGGLAMVDVTNEDDAQRRLATGCWMLDAGGAMHGARLSFAHFSDLCARGLATRETPSPAASASRCAHGSPRSEEHTSE